MRVEETIYKILNDNEIEWTEEMNKMQIAEAGIDSMMFIQLVVDMEEEFGFELNDEDLILELYETMDDIIDKIKKYIE